MSESPQATPAEAGKEQTTPGLGDRRRIRVLMYHRILPEGEKGSPPQMRIPVRQFRREMELLARWGYTAITFDDYRLYLTGELNLPRKPVIITFEDGYVETYTLVLPILQELGMKAVVFVVADAGIRSSVWDRVQPEAVTPLLSDDQILELHAVGFEIGSQTLHHVRLPGLPREKAWEEISGSRMALEILLNAPVRSFTYPFGLLDDQVKAIVKEEGFTVGCCGWTGPALFGDDLFEIRRVTMFPYRSFADLNFAIRLISPYQLYRWLWWRLRVALEASGVRKKPFNPEAQ